MFNEIIHLNRENEIRYGTTKKSYHETLGKIMELLEDSGCDRIASLKEGDTSAIAFEFQGKPYMIKIPRVYIKGIFDDRKGIRVVYYYLQILLGWSKKRVMNFEFMMLGSRMVNIKGQTTTLKEAVDKLPPVDLIEGLTFKHKQLKDGDVIEMERSQEH